MHSIARLEMTADPASEEAAAFVELRAWLARVVPRDADLVLNVLVCKRTCGQVGRDLGLTPNTAQQRLGRAVEKLRQLLDKRLSLSETADPRFRVDEQQHRVPPLPGL
jgi:DNA-directed RNA polymerase specialized sigma24 family protein